MIDRLLTQNPEAFIAISGGFNHASLFSSLLTFKQFVKCPTRGNKTFDVLFTNTKDAYSSSALPPHGISDPVTYPVRGWSHYAYDALQDRLGSTDWSLIENSNGEGVEGSID